MDVRAETKKRLSRNLVATTALATVLAPMLGAPALGADETADDTVAVTTPTGHVVYLRADTNDDYNVGRIGAGVTVRRTESGSVSLWADGYAGVAREDGQEDFTAGSVGVAYRRQRSEADSWGVHAFVDAGQFENADDTFGQVSFGGDFARVFDPETNRTVRVGGNLYVPFDDYTDVTNYGVVDSAPLLGVDGFVEFGRDLTDRDMRLNLTLGAFDYFSGEDSEDLRGGFASAGLAYSSGLPEGLTASGEVGVRFANGGDGFLNQDGDVSPFFGAQLSYAWGGSTVRYEEVVTRTAIDPARDCVVVREGEGEPEYDCSEPVITDADTVGKDGQPVNETLPAATRRETRRVEAQGRPPVAPRRNIAFGSPFAPIHRPNPEPPTDEPPTDEPPTDEPPTDEPPTDEPPTDEPPTDEPPTDEPPTDEPPTDEPPTDEPPTDEPPTDEPPTDEPPTDEPPTDEPPTDEPPHEHDDDCGHDWKDKDDDGHGGGHHGGGHHGDHNDDDCDDDDDDDDCDDDHHHKGGWWPWW
jgi:hypothetical protein